MQAALTAFDNQNFDIALGADPIGCRYSKRSLRHSPLKIMQRAMYQ